jgi:hypothetical protein
MADEQAKNLQSRFLRKRGKGIESGRYIHIFGIMEMLFGRAVGVKERNPDGSHDNLAESMENVSDS